MADMTKFRPGKQEGTIVTAKCRLIYPSLFVPTDMKGSTQGPEDKLKYRLGILVPKTADIKALQEGVDRVIGENAPAKDRQFARKPFIKVADQRSLAKYADEFPLLLRVSSKYPPEVVGPGMQRLQEDECYSGRWGRCTLFPFWYPSIDGGKPGVALGLNTVQYLDHADRIGGNRASAEDDFEAVDDVDSEDEGAQGVPDGLDAMFN